MRVSPSKENSRQSGNAPAATDRPSVLRQGLTIEGRLHSTGDVHLYGTVVGDIQARKVIVWPQGFVEGEIVAEEAHIHGQLRGRVVARTVVISESAEIEGQIFHHKIDLAKGAQVKGRLPWRPVNYFDDFDHHFQQAG